MSKFLTNTFKVFTICAVVSTMFLMNTSNLHSDSFKGVCKICGNVTGTYHWETDKNENKTTVFVSDDGEWYIEKKGSHTTFIIGEGNGEEEELFPMPTNLTADVNFTITQSDVIVGTDMPIIVKLVDILAGSFISEDINVGLNGELIDISNLPVGGYAIAVFQDIPGIGRINTELHMFYKEQTH